MSLCLRNNAGKPNPNNAVTIIYGDGYLTSVRVDHGEGMNYLGKLKPRRSKRTKSS